MSIESSLLDESASPLRRTQMSGWPLRIFLRLPAGHITIAPKRKSMKVFQKVVLGGLLALLILSLAAILLTHRWVILSGQLNVARAHQNYSSEPVDTRALQTAQQLAPLAVTAEEQDLAQEAMRMAGKSVDYGFQAALRDAEENPPEPTSETRELSARLKQAQEDVGADEDRVASLTQKLAKARRRAKESVQQQLDLAQAQLSLDKDEAEDAHQDLIRAGGDMRATIQAQLDRHTASIQHAGAPNSLVGSGAASSAEATTSQSVIAELRAWFSLRNKENLLRQAQQNAAERLANLSQSHDALGARVKEEKARKKILHKKAAPAAALSPVEDAGNPAEPDSAITFARQLSQQQHALSEFSQRIVTERELAAIYGKWLAAATIRSHAFLHGLFRSLFWIFLITLLIFLANEGIQRFFADLTSEARQLHAMRAAILLAVQALGVILILLVIFGVPGNFATVAALAGAGLTVALKDFIVGFLGWFVLIGKDGVRPGDWVEINGVGGEVLEVGPLHTVLLETGNWADAAHPTGRKVTFVNSFAIEGHYFNFSSSGQWLWDELQVLVPVTIDPYSIGEAMQKLAAEETAANARLAEQEWERVTPTSAKRSFTADPSMTVRPSGEGVNVLVRYITRASERQEVRTRLYRAVVDLLSKRNVPEPGISPSPRQSVANRTV
jgi:small-conductance mechanosensitive channel